MANSSNLSRRSALSILSALGVGSASFQRALAADAAKRKVTSEMISQAEWVAGIELTDEQRSMASSALTRANQRFESLRAHELDNGLAPALVFKPIESHARHTSFRPSEVRFSESHTIERPTAEDDLAFLPVSELSSLIRQRSISSTELTKIYLKRLKRFDPLLKCVVTLTEELALAQAAKADQEIMAGHYRGPLHGIPWGAKDLLAMPGYRTTWGAPLNRDRMIDQKAAVIQKLESAGAVLVAKLTTGYYALGDQWFGGRTRNPWDPSQGSSGSSAGSASAVSAGLVGFAIGTETHGSIISPSQRCGVTGLRPTFGRVSRYGCMTLTWSMDKIGPICRRVEDCAAVLGFIHGADGRDPASVDRKFQWPTVPQPGNVRIGYVEKDEQYKNEISVLRDLGFKLTPIEIPKTPNEDFLNIILTTETAAVFDELTRKGEPKGVNYWPKTFAMGQFVSAIDYLRANRIRRQVMEAMHGLFESVDVVVGPSMSLATNLTGQPKISLPNGFRRRRSGHDVPTSLMMTGAMYQESTLLAVAHAYQQATTHHLKHPPLDEYLAKRESFHDENDVLDPDVLYGN